MSATLPSLLASLAVLLLGRMDRLADACSCSPVHPQQAFCNADVVIRAKAVSEKEVDSGNDIYGNPIKRIQYEIKQIKMFKGPDQDIEFIYTAPSSAVCGVTLDVTGKKEYLIAGKSEGNGKMHITLCDFIIPWDSLSATQKKSLNQRYQMGCECKVINQIMRPFQLVDFLLICMREPPQEKRFAFVAVMAQANCVFYLCRSPDALPSPAMSLLRTSACGLTG
uniref:Metalloproteinase inhibitor 2 n=1 Tax=Podarcis muralis TaxID=64176 RepID=A0A670HVN9_PODMU